MISKVSTFLGPGSIFNIGGTPSLVLSLDAGNILSYPPIGFTVSFNGTTHILNPNPSQEWSGWNTYGNNYIFGGDFIDSATPSAGWYLVDDNGNTRQVLSTPVWFTDPNPTPVYNGTGWFLVLDDTYSITNTFSTITFYESEPTVTPVYNNSGTWLDLSKLNNDATPQGNINYSSNGGGSFEFDSESSYFNFTNPVEIPIGDSPYTIEVWFKSNDYSPSQQGALVSWGTPYTPGYSNVLRLDGNGFLNYWWADDISVSFGSSQSLLIDNWYYVVATYDGTQRKLYLNGQLIKTNTPSGPHLIDDSTTLKIGYDGINYFDGKISKVKVHTKALFDNNILSNFNTDKVRHGIVLGSMTFSSSASSYVWYNSNYALENDFTIEAFVKPIQLAKSGIVSFSTEESPVNGGPRITLTSGGSFNFWTSPVGSSFSSFTASIDRWYHVAMSRTSGTVSCYINGSLEGQFYDDTYFNNLDMVIGRTYTVTSENYFDGYISNVRVTKSGTYTASTITIPSTPLSWQNNTNLLIVSQQTTATSDLSGIGSTVSSYNVGWTNSLPSLYVTDGLICYLDNYTGGSTWYDLSGNGNNATLYGGYSYNATNDGVIRFDGVGTQNVPTSASRGEINLDLTLTPCTIMYGTRYLQNTPGYQPSGRSLGGRYNNWLLGTWANKVNQFFHGNGFVIGGNPGDSTDMNWHIYTGTVNGTVSFWNNGDKLVSSGPNGEGPNGIVLGSDLLGESANCDISFVLVYDRILSDSEIQINFDYFRDRLGL